MRRTHGLAGIVVLAADKSDKAGKSSKGGKADKSAAAKDKVEPIRIDFDGLADRIVQVPVQPGNYDELRAVDGKLHWLESSARGMMPPDVEGNDSPGADLETYDIEKEKRSTVTSGVLAYQVSLDGKVLVVSHKATIRLLISSLLGFDARGYRDRLDQSPACLNILDFRDPVHSRLMLFNDVSHYVDQPPNPEHRLSKVWDAQQTDIGPEL